MDDATINALKSGVTIEGMAFLDGFTTALFSAAWPRGMLDCIQAFSLTDFRSDPKFKLPTLVIHGASDAIVPLQIRGALRHKAIAGSQLCLVEGGPHGFNV